jgi:mannose-6-phosphate isomerase-like protein (cupin superfamily)
MRPTGSGVMYSDLEDEKPAGPGDVVFTPRGHWHGFRNTGDVDVVLVWGWSGAGSLEDAGYEVAHRHADSDSQ